MASAPATDQMVGILRDTIVALLRHEGLTYRRLTGEAGAALTAAR